MKFVHLVCLFAVLISMLMFAQTNRAPFASPPKRMPANSAPTLQGPTFAQRRAGGGHVTTQRRGGSPMSGLDFAPAVTYGSGGYGPEGLAVADLNGDGNPDLVMANCGEGSVGVLLGNSDGTFSTAVPYSSGGFQPPSVAIADVNGDGRPDLVVANNCPEGDNCADGAVGVLFGNGDGTFQTVVTYGSGGYWATSVAVADVNGDGRPDIVVTNRCASSTQCGLGTVGVLLNNGDGSFQAAVTYGSGGYWATSVVVADVNGDGKPDLLAASLYEDRSDKHGVASVLLGNGDGTFKKAVPYGTGGQLAEWIAVADIDGDGRPDLLVSNSGSDDVGVLLGNGDGTFKKAVAYDSGSIGLISVAVADVNGDGKPDLVVAECANSGCANEGLVGVLLGKGDGTFQTVVTYGSGGTGPYSVVIADVNRDGKPDLMVTDANTSSVGVLINTTLSPTTTTLTSSLNPSNFGQSVTFTATVTSQGFKGTPTGTVTFYNGTTSIGTSNLNKSGVATLTTSKLPVGTDRITATYNGDSNFAPSTSPVLRQVVDGAVVRFSPASLDFGDEDVGSSSKPKDVKLTNTGNVDLTITSIQVTGTDGSDFTETNSCPSSLSPKDSCQIQVTFTPTQTGERKADLAITDNAPRSPLEAPLSGVGVSPEVTFFPTSLTFPTQLVYTTSQAKQVTLSNTGNGVLNIASISITGAFSQTNNCPPKLSAGSKCTINVKFHPKTEGVQNGTVNIKDNAPGSPQQVPLTGTCTYLEFTPAKLNFGTQPVGTKSLPKRVAMTNKADVAVNISNIAITGSDQGDYSETNNCGTQLASGASCFIKVTFDPQETGKRSADVSVTDDGGGSPQQVPLTGTGT